ncbi:MAG: molybdenum cofactor biosynthesis protein MoaE [Hyphomicrobiales bacterium]|jgi:molybdopterin synthase catalytic subunit
MKIKVQAEPFDAGAEIAALHNGNPAIGAVTSFTGYCRDEGGKLAALELEHFPGMAEGQLTAIAEQASERWPLHGITIIHRYGKLKPGDPIVLVVTASSHRRAAFEAADFLMDFLKTKAPFWKKEHPASPDEEARWVEAKASDDADADRW